MRRTLALAAVASTGCGPELLVERIEWPKLDPSVVAVILAIESVPLIPGDTEAVRLEGLSAHRLDDASLIFDFEEAPVVRLSVFTFERSLESYLLTPGRIPRPASGEPSRGLPDAEEILTRAYPSDASWSPTGLSDVLRSVRIPWFNPFECLEGGGCLGDGHVDECLTPCPVDFELAPPLPVEPWVAPGIFTEVCPGTATTTVERRALRVCDPPRAAIGCGRGEAQPPDLDVCVRIGPTCPARFGQAPTGVVRYVDDDATAPGDGSLAAPFSTIAEAVNDSTPGTTIVIARGVYREEVVLDRAITILGACTSDTIIEPPSGAAILVQSVSRVQSVTLVGGAPGVLVGAGAFVDLTNVAIEGGVRGIDVRGGVMKGRGISIRGASDFGACVLAGGQMNVDRAVIEDISGVGLCALDPSTTLFAADVVIRRTTTRDVYQGLGLWVSDGARAEVDRALIEGTHRDAILARSPGTRLTFSDFVVRSDTAFTMAPDSFALSALGGAEVIGRRFEARRLEEVVRVSMGSTTDLEDFSATAQESISMPRLSAAIHVTSQGELSIRRGRLESTATNGVMVFEGGSAHIEDFSGDGRLVSVPFFVDSATLEVARATVTGCEDVCLRTAGSMQTMVSIEDLETKGTIAGGIVLGGAGEIHGQRLAVRNPVGTSFHCVDTSRSMISDLLIAGAKRAPPLRLPALEMKTASGGTIERFIIEDGELTGLHADTLGLTIGAKKVSQGIVRRNPVGFEFLDNPSLLPTVLPLVRFEDNVLLRTNADGP